MIYSYAELKGKIKVGDKVSAVKGKYNQCSELNSDGSNVAIVTLVNEDCFAINYCVHIYHKGSFLNLNPQNDMQEKTWDNLANGDIIEDPFGRKGKVLLVLEDVFLRSECDDFDAAAGWRTKAEAQRAGFTIKQPEVTKTMTHEEVWKVLGYKVEFID